MAKYPLIARVPEIWRRLDKDDVSRGLFTAIDNELDRIGDTTEDYLSLVNVDLVPDKFLPLLADLVGHIWRIDRTYLWNRNRIRFAIKRASYKGTPECIKDLARDCGATSCEIVDMASKVIVESWQGHYGSSDCHYFDSDYYHPGVFQLYFSEDIDIEAFDEEFQHIKPAGTRWYYNFVISSYNAVVETIPITCSELSIGEESIAVSASDAFNFINSLTFFVSDTDISVSDNFLTLEQNTRQPAVEPVVELPV